MITIDDEGEVLKAHVFDELTLADFQGLETAITHRLESGPKVKILVDLRMMTGFTVDVAWEDIKFVTAHAHDFKRIAVVSDDQWYSWLSWLTGAFTDAEIEIFSDYDEALSWIEQSD